MAFGESRSDRERAAGRQDGVPGEALKELRVIEWAAYELGDWLKNFAGCSRSLWN